MPYIAAWSGEKERGARVIETERGIGYADETLLDRDDHGVLWTRAASRPGFGEPRYAEVHPLRQRQAMHHLLCQVCAGPADQNDQGTLWLLHDHQGDWADWPNGMANTHPPLCLRCARISVRACPSLQSNYVAVRAHSKVAGVAGGLYRAGYPLPQLIDYRTVAFGKPEIRWLRASQLIRVLRGCVIMPL